MTKSFQVPIKLANISTDPTGVNGALYYNTTSNSLKYYNGTSWVSLSASSGGGTTTNALTLGTGLTGGSFNGFSAVTATVDSSVIPYLANANTFTTTQTITQPSAGTKPLIVQAAASGLTATITAASQSAGTVTYTASNTFSAGQQVTVTGITPTTLNVTNAKIVSASSSQFTIVNPSVFGTYSSGGTATAYSDLQQWQTNAGTVQLSVNQAGYVTTSNVELVLESTGDGYGPTRLRLQNRNGQNGPLFDTSSSTVDLVDFGFKSITSQGNIRYENRYGNGQVGIYAITSTNGPEFQIGNTVGFTVQSYASQVQFPLIVGNSLNDRRVQVNSTTGNTVPLTVKAKPTVTATITGATVTTFANKTGTISAAQAAAIYTYRITGLSSTTGLLPGMILTYVSGTGTFGTGGTGVIVSVDSSTAITVYTTGSTSPVSGSITFSIQNSVTYTSTNTFNQTDSVTITGITPSTLNDTNVTIGAVAGSSFTTINTVASGTYTSGGTATVTQNAGLFNLIGSSGSSVASIDASGNITAGTHNGVTISGTGTVLTSTSTTSALTSFGSSPTISSPTLTGTITASGNLIENVNTTAKTAAYTLATTDYNTLIQMNGAFAFTVGTTLSAAPVGTKINLLALTAGVSVTASGTTIYATPGLKLRAQYSAATLICLASNVWLLTGDLSA